MARPQLHILACLLLHGCADYKYEHSVTGKVVDEMGKPVADAEVRRVRSSTGKADYGAAHMYRRQTDRSGAFSFAYSGLGHKPEPETIWHLRVTARGFEPRVQTLRIPWSNAQGYEQHRIVIEVRSK